MLRRLYEPEVYAPTPAPSYWEAGLQRPDLSTLEGAHSADVAIVGAGYAGLSAALHLAEAGVDVAVVDAAQPGWGASGRNGGFCCLGGAALPRAAQIRRFGRAQTDAHLRMQAGAVARVAGLIDRCALDVDKQGAGEICLAHRAWEMAELRAQAALYREVLGVEAQILQPSEAQDAGLGMAGQQGALHLGLGFGLHPLKYALGLVQAAQSNGVRLFAHSPVTALQAEGAGWRAVCGMGTLRARKVIVATNGYSSESLPHWLGGRYLPVLSNIMVTRPLTGAELQAQGWTSPVMSYDSRSLLHYFRLLPDNRMLLGMRGNVRATPRAAQSHRAALRAHFEALFPAWRGVDTAYHWSGLACMMRDRLSYIGPVPQMPGVFTGLGWHGNGVAMATEAGARLAQLVQGAAWEDTVPAPARAPARRFPLAPLRRNVLSLAYGWYRITDGPGP